MIGHGGGQGGGHGGFGGQIIGLGGHTGGGHLLLLLGPQQHSCDGANLANVITMRKSRAINFSISCIYYGYYVLAKLKDEMLFQKNV